MREIIRVLRSQARTGSIPKFNHVELNALRLQTPKHAYSTIAEELMGQKFSPEKRASSWRSASKTEKEAMVA